MNIKKFILRLILFVVPIVLLAVAFELYLRKIPNDYAFKRNYLDKNSNQIEVLFLGNSHVFYGINPEMLDYNSFNASNVSQSLNLDLAILEKYENQWKKLKVIVLPIDYFSFFLTLEKGTEKWRAKNYNIYYKIPISFNFKDYLEIAHGKTSKNFERATKYYFHKKTHRSCNKLGFGLGNSSKHNQDLIKTGNESVRKHTIKEIDEDIRKGNLKSLHSILEFSKKHNIKVLFVTCPAYKTYTSKLDKKQLDYTIQTIEKMVSNHKNTFYINLLKDTSYHAEDFHDADHFNEKGAQKFTKRLDEIIKNLL
jgi:hypothetical protein